MVAVPAAAGVVQVVHRNGDRSTASFGENSPAVCAVAFLDGRLVAATESDVNVFVKNSERSSEKTPGGWTRIGYAPVSSATQFVPQPDNAFLSISTTGAAAFGQWQASGSLIVYGGDSYFGRAVNQVLPFGNGSHVVSFHDDGSTLFSKSASGWARVEGAVVGEVDPTAVVFLATTSRWVLAQAPDKSLLFEVRQ